MYKLTDEFDKACKREGWALFANDEGTFDILKIDDVEEVGESIRETVN